MIGPILLVCMFLSDWRYPPWLWIGLVIASVAWGVRMGIAIGKRA